MDLTVPEAVQRGDGSMTRHLPQVPNLNGVADPRALTEIIFTIANRGVRP